MRELPILFSGPMVRAILEGRKSQTRRLVKYDDECMGLNACTHLSDTHAHFDAMDDMNDFTTAIPFPYRGGDQLWLKETFWAFGRWETRFSAKKGRDEWHFVDMTLDCGGAYHFADPTSNARRQRGDLTPAWWKRPSLFMPRFASRITLEVTGVRVERLQDISEADAIAEGMQEPSLVPITGACWSERHVFSRLWKHLNGDDSWEANPWVWVIEFKRVAQSA